MNDDWLPVNRRVKAKMPEPTPSQLKIDGMPETEVLRIEGNVIVPKDYIIPLKAAFESMIESYKATWSGNITDQDSPTGMRLYRVEEVEGYKKQTATAEKIISNMLNDEAENHEAFKDLAEQLRHEQEAKKQFIELYERSKKVFYDGVHRLTMENIALKKRLELKDSPIKAGLKRIWKWFKGLVGK